MIVVEERLNDVFSQLPEIDGFKPVYKWGNEFHLIKQLTEFGNNSRSPYPLIYQTSMSEVQDVNKKEATVRLVFILATRNTETALLNENRWAMSYDKVLFPLAKNIEKSFTKSGIFRWDEKYRLTKYPNFGGEPNTKQEANFTTDIWDALKFETLGDVSIIDRCINEIRF